jgi:hydrogenase maturation protease
MSETLPCQIALLGLGNLMRTDDAVGMLTLRRLEECGLLPPEVRVIEGGTLGLDLLESLRGISHLLVLDAVDGGVVPGTILRFEGEEIDNLRVSKSVRLLGFSDLICALRLMDAAPAEAVLLGVQPASTDWGTALTPEVLPAQQTLMQSALEQLTRWKVEVSETGECRFSTSHPGQKQADSANANWNTY